VLLTACLNDLGGERLFSRQLEAFAGPGDVLVGLSTSGRSANLVEAFRYCREAGIRTLLFSGGQGGVLAGMADLAVLVPDGGPGRIQELHLALGHLIIERVEADLFAMEGENDGIG
jgi:phosphoheptose isomerase